MTLLQVTAYTLLVGLLGVNECHAVPATASDKLWDEIANVKIIMASVSGELREFNSLYLSKLESRLVAIATQLSSLDSNVKNLQERAHVWDTFQLHVAAWNQQIGTIDKKVDILSRGQDKLSLMDGKVNSLVSLDYKVERLVRKMDEADNKLTVIAKTLDNQRDDPLFGEFATRGILSTLKVVERKLDRIEAQWRGGRRQQQDDDMAGGDEAAVGPGKLVIKCNTPAAVEELLRDVASKVDVIFDRVSHEEDEGVTVRGVEEEGEVMEQPRRDTVESRLLEKLWKRLTSPAKKATRMLESLEKSTRLAENRTGVLATLLQQVLPCCQRHEQHLATLANATSARAEQHTQLIEQLRDAHARNISCRIGNDSVASTEEGREEEATTAQPSKEIEDEDMPPRLLMAGCESLTGTASLSGVYSFGTRDDNEAGRDFGQRFCAMDSSTGGGWTVIQRRGDFPDPQQNFSLSWRQYQLGFGDLQKEFWFGNDYIHRLTNQGDMTLRIELEGSEGRTAWAQYASFRVESAAGKYRLHIGGYTGNATDSFSAHHGAMFSTVDRTNDAAPACCPCAPAYGGGWWFYSCFEANLNGAHYGVSEEREEYRGLIWEHWLGDASLRGARMMLRPSHAPTRAPTTPTPVVTTEEPEATPADADEPEDP